MEDQTVAQVPDVSLNHLNFDYCISTDGFFRSSPSWKPVRVFDDGVHTYIQFPALMTHRDMPVLFISKNNTQQLVNYRSKAPYFVVDKIFKEAVLVMGVGSDQTKVIITNKRYQ
jgi:type IV secretion system protein VirB9